MTGEGKASVDTDLLPAEMGREGKQGEQRLRTYLVLR